jgi:ADP-dependent NAD(P)H-hydrate dehydratase / NAD(P)H-hydrate epimerase
MRRAHQVAKVRAAEATAMARLGDSALMRRAAFGLAAVCAGLLDPPYGARVVVLAGSGDNGGDAMHAGALLARRGASVHAVTAGSRMHQGGADALRAAGGRLIGPADRAVPGLIEDADLIVDGMLGVGGRGGLREPYASLAGQAARSRAIVVAADLPSGIDADSGVVEGPAVRADVTVTFGTWKPGLLVDPGAGYAGVTELIDIGLGSALEEPDLVALQSADVAALLPRPSAESDKYRRGVLGLLAGSERFTGAAWLATGGAVRGGAGMVRLVSATAAAAVVRQHWPEAVITITDPGEAPARVLETTGRVQAWAAGPGMGTSEDSADLMAAVLATDLPVLVDADGLTLLAAERGLLPRPAPTLLTPHAGEMARLLGASASDVEARRLEYARKAASELGATVLLKGSTTVIVGPGEDEPALVNPTGTPWLATAGTGDVLTGLAGALLAQGLAASHAAAVAAYLHGLAARLAAAGQPSGEHGGHWPMEPDGPRPEPDATAPIGAADVLSALPAAIRAVQAAPRQAYGDEAP